MGLSAGLVLGAASCESNPSPQPVPPTQSAGAKGVGPNLQVDSVALAESVELDEEDFAATDCALIEGCVNGPGTRKLLRFEADIINAGNQDIYLGDPSQNSNFKFSPCHGHYHLQNIMEYALINSITGAPVVVNRAPVVVRKQGFCLEDSQPYSDEAIASGSDGKYDCSNQGILAGWEDVYDNSLDCQWLDITGVPPGTYTLRLTVNPDHAFPDTNLEDNVAETQVTIY